MKQIEIKTRFNTQRNGEKAFRMTIKNNGWRFWNDLKVNYNSDIIDYVKCDEFKEYAYSVFSKYEGMTYKEICEANRSDDFLKIQEKLDAYSGRKDEPFKIGYHTKLVKTYSDGVRFKLQFGNNIDRRSYSWTISLKTGFNCRVDNYSYGYDVMGEFEWQFRKLIGDKLDKYTSWDEFINDIDTEVAPVENAVFYSMKEKFNKLAA